MTEEDPWRCATCARHYPIKPLARDCETRHRLEGRQGSEDPAPDTGDTPR